MQKFLLLIALLFVSILGFAQKVVAFSFCDIDDRSIGDGCARDQQNMHKLFNRISATLGYSLEEHVFVGNDFTASKFESCTKELELSSDDIILFYVSCHGGRSITDKTSFPQLKIRSKLVSAYDKYDSLKKLPHRSLVMLIDACNVIRSITPKEIRLFPKNLNPTIKTTISPQETFNIKQLLVNNGFDVIVTSSQVGVSSISTSEGSIFTNSFISALEYYIQSDQKDLIYFGNVLDRSRDYTYNESRRQYINNRIDTTDPENRPHYPIWEPDPYVQNNFFAKNDVSAKQFRISYSSKKLNRLEKMLAHTRNDYKVVFQLEADKGLMERIKSVKYILHHTFKKPEVYATDVRHSYRYTIYIWGEFLLRAEITLDDGSIIDVGEDLKIF